MTIDALTVFIMAKQSYCQTNTDLASMLFVRVLEKRDENENMLVCESEFFFGRNVKKDQNAKQTKHIK